jgi:HK97 family phage major capsid protein
MAGIDTNRTTAGASDLLPKQISSEIWANAIEESEIMQAARQIPLPGSGVTVPIITGDSEADWVAETAEKPVSQATLGSKSITPYKLAVIELFSDEFRRDLTAVYAELARRLPKALGTKFDATVLNGTAPGSNFDVLTNSTAVTVDATDTIGDLANVLTAVGATGADVTKWLISPQAEGRIMTAKDGQGNYAFLRDARTDSGAIGSIFGRDVLKSKAVYAAGTPNVIGFAGDFANSALWGSVEGIKVDITDNATVNKGGTQVNLWQRNMFAVRAEIEVGFAVKNAAHFVKLTDGATGGGEG